MKITIYELIGLVKDDNAPKQIMCDNIPYKYNRIVEDYFNDDLEEYLFEMVFCKNCMSLFMDDEVIIIEGPNKLEKINPKYWDNSEYTPEQRINVCMTHINELIVKVNNIKEND